MLVPNFTFIARAMRKYCLYKFNWRTLPTVFFLMTIPLPTFPGLSLAESSVNITIVWSVTGSRIFWMYFLSASSDVNLSGNVNVMLGGIQNISKAGGVSVGILIRWVSVLKFLEIVIKSCLTWWPR